MRRNKSVLRYQREQERILFSLRILFCSVCLHWFWKHSATTLTLLCNSSCSIWLDGPFCHGAKGLVFFIPRMVWIASYGSIVWIKSIIATFHVQCEKPFRGAALCFICCLVCSPDSCLIWMVGLAPAAALALWEDEACMPLGDTDWTAVCCALGICRIWDGELTRALGDGRRVEANFTAADEPPEPTHTHTLTYWNTHSLSHTHHTLTVRI